MGAIKKIIAAAVLPALCFLAVSCATAQQEDHKGKELTVADKNKSAELLKILDEINTGSPDTISSSFSAEGDTSGKKFRVEGMAVYDKKGYYNLSLTDYIFKSPVIDAYRDGDKLYFYYPAEKKLIADDLNRINFYSYSGFKADFAFIQTFNILSVHINCGAFSVESYNT